ncbi:MAG: ABC transporter transmembrane domain-containing protein, partial [Acidimicrobiia bacterium]|nr:ABC transporter transmembrane domain-containing protein [Acidimicrobiia bacterium]
MTAVRPVEDVDVDVGAMEVLRRGVAVSPELRQGFLFTAAMAILAAIGKLMIPILIQQILDKGVNGQAGFRPGFVYGTCALAGVVIFGVFLVSRVTYLRLVQVAEGMLMGLRVRTFAHIQKLSLADHVDSRRGILTARVTSDIETLAQFAQWGAISWVVNSIVIVGTIAVMAWYSWALTLVTVAVYLPMVPLLRALQRRQFVAYDRLRSRVAETLGSASEAVMGASVIRAYGYQAPVRGQLLDTNDKQFATQVSAHKFFAWLAPLTDFFGAVALSAVVAVGIWWGAGAGLTSGELVAFLFLVTILLNPIAEIGEVLDQTQTALAGWWKILQILDTPVEITEPEPGVVLPQQPLGIRTEGMEFTYRV